MKIIQQDLGPLSVQDTQTMLMGPNNLVLMGPINYISATLFRRPIVLLQAGGLRRIPWPAPLSVSVAISLGQMLALG